MMQEEGEPYWKDVLEPQRVGRVPAVEWRGGWDSGQDGSSKDQERRPRRSVVLAGGEDVHSEKGSKDEG